MDVLPAAHPAPPCGVLPAPTLPGSAVSPVLASPAARPVERRPAPWRAPETLHPALWLGHQLGRSGSDAVPSGFPRLDAQLPGGGWPRRGLSELLLSHPGIGEIRLLAPTLIAAQQAGRLVMFFDPPAALSALALARLGFDVEALLVVHTAARGASAPLGAELAAAPAGRRAGASARRPLPGNDSLWALEQALKSGHVGAVLAWLPSRLRVDRLRRLQLAAHSHNGVAFVLREAEVADRPTAAPLRLSLRAAGADRLDVSVLKRRGPPLELPLQLPLPPVLSAPAERRSGRAAEARAPYLQQATFVHVA